MKRPYLRSLAHRGKLHQPNTSVIPKIQQIYTVFWTRAPLLSMVAGSTSASSCTARTTIPRVDKITSIPNNTAGSRANSNSRADAVCILNKLNIVLSCTPDLQSLPPAARLPYCLQNWQVITSYQWVLKVVQGYQLELTSTWHQRGAPYPLVDHQHWQAVEEEVQKLLEKGAILKVEPCPGQFISRLLVTKKDESFRPVVTLKPLNQFIARAHYKMEGINMLKDLLLENDWMASIDLKDAYLSVAVKAEHRKYLRFVWAEQMYEFQCLPFGLSSTPRVFTKLLKPIVGLLRRQGIHFVIFLDDILVLAQSKEDLVIQMDQIARMFSLLGFSINLEKSQLSLPARWYSFPTTLIGKKRTVGAPPRQVIFEAFPMDKRLCVAECL